MKLKLLILLNIVCVNVLFAQVVIGNKNYSNNNAVLSIINTEDNKENSKGLLLPTVESKDQLPLYNSSEVDEYLDDPTMAGMIMYQKDLKRAVLYDGEKWKPTLYEDDYRSSRYSLNTRLIGTSEENYPQLACVLVACGTRNIPFAVTDPNLDYDELKLKNDQINYSDDTYTNFEFQESGMYKVLISLSVKTSGLHVTPPVISVRARKNDFVIARNDVALNEAILITAGANRAGTMEFVGMFRKGDKLTIQMTGAVSIATVADVYTVMPNSRTFLYLEKLF
ncbi:hypothetical protein OBJ68_01840 [Empedobacter falsenii]